MSGPTGSPNPPNAWDQLCSSARADGPNTAHNGPELRVDGRDLGFDTRCLIAPAGEPFTIRFGNHDAGIPRNVSIFELTPYLRGCIVTGTAPSQDLARPLFRGAIIEGKDQIVYRIAPFEPGEYYFEDQVDPGANGVLVVE